MSVGDVEGTDSDELGAVGEDKPGLEQETFGRLTGRRTVHPQAVFWGDFATRGGRSHRETPQFGHLAGRSSMRGIHR